MATSLAKAADIMAGKTKVKQSDVRRIAKIAKKCRQGQATGQEIAWAKRLAAPFMARNR